ncbi:ATP-binding protein [Salipaludibacillus sp. CF4.18]|uniref:ATP-binding protein n=1 Tax=Salipaludibacillus sp. CF4.18 TaxID=3373081 RepID=UPI003EE6CE4C
MSAIGELAAGIAHEIRNPLTTIKGFTEFLNATEEDEKKKSYYKLLLEETERINFIVSEFMVLAKPQAILLKPINIIPTIKKVFKFLEAEFNLKNIIISLDINYEHVVVECDENLIKQVLFNVLKNGMEAMPGGGTLQCKVSIKNDMVSIIVKDEGIGISENNLKKLGDPFYSTKEEGNGLGLMVCFNIIENHKGEIQIESKENSGTTFTIMLPSLEFSYNTSF